MKNKLTLLPLNGLSFLLKEMQHARQKKEAIAKRYLKKRLTLRVFFFHSMKLFFPNLLDRRQVISDRFLQALVPSPSAL